MAANTGRPSDYLVEVADDICSLLASGESLNSICKRKGFPSRNTVYRWLREYQDFRDNYARATDDRADSIFEEMLDISDNVIPDNAEIAKARLKIETRKWVLSRMNPKKYSDKQSIEHTGPNGGDINVTITRRVID